MNLPDIKSFLVGLIALVIISMFQSCREVIDIELKDANKQLVVEGGISDRNEPDTVTLTTTVNFSDPNSFPPVTNAILTLKDNEGNKETLTEMEPGKYVTHSLQGKPGNTYTLIILYDDREYTAVSSMPYPVGVDTITMEPSLFGLDSQLNVAFTDPAGIENYYRLLTYKEDTLISSSILNDELQDGNVIRFPVFTGWDLSPGDSIKVALQSIDKDIFEYFRTLQQVSSGGIQAASPANPLNNITNGALGYFSTYAVTERYFVVP